ncbi:MAG: hypothetical protein KBT11_05140, partial [Treponema sp.]|nr:hypothetical protein [Candidatus Treponema equifaecale]
VMSVALIELVEMTATLYVVVSRASTTANHTYWTPPKRKERIFCLPSGEQKILVRMKITGM